MSDLPKTWLYLPMLDILPIVSTGVSSFVGEVPYFSTGSIQSNFAVSEGNYTFETRPARANRWMMEGDVVQARMKGTDKSFLIDSNYSSTLFSTGFLHFRPNPNIYNSRLLKFYLSSKEFLDQRDEFATGSTQEALTDTNATKLTIPLPPLNEQKRIVEKLEKLIHKVEAVQTRLDKIPAILKRFHQAVLAAACSGKLTVDWRLENNQNEDWKCERLEDVCENIVDCPHSTPRWAESGIICIRTTNFKPNFLDLSEVRYISEETYQERTQRLVPKANDIVYSREGGILGIACIIPENVQLALGQRMMLMRTKDSYLPRLLMYWLNSPEILEKVRDLTGGSAAPHLNVRDIKNFQVPVTTIEEQKEIVRRVEELFKFANQIEARYQKARSYTDKITQSILAKAFSGELVEEYPDDEPASTLLDRIRLLRDEQEKKPKKTLKVKKKNMKLTKEKIEETIKNLPDDKFSFDELSKQVSSDYESLKVLFFNLLDDPKPIITQVFDQQTNSIQFIREQK